MYLYAKSQIELHTGRTELSNVLERIIREGSFEKDYSRRMRIRKIKDHTLIIRSHCCELEWQNP